MSKNAMNPKNTKVEVSRAIIVGVGASAGGLEAFQELLRELGDGRDLAIVFVQHLERDNEALLIDLLRKSTSIQVTEVTGRKKLKAGTVYVCPAWKLLELKNGTAKVVEGPGDDRPASPIDFFLSSLAQDQGEHGVGVILSGNGSDGTLGLKSISDSGGMTFAQSAESAKYDSMPRSAATTGVADHVMDPKQIAAEIKNYAEYLSDQVNRVRETPLDEQIYEAIPVIAKLLVEATNHNFQHYKQSTLARRIRRRMQVLKLPCVETYVSLLRDDSEEPNKLFREMLISVTAFFRDPEAFEELSKSVIPQLFDSRRSGDVVRIWVPGCATGEEAFSLAILCRERMEQMDSPPEVQIFATDIDERALNIARQGTYPIGIEEDISEERLRRFFIKRGKKYQITKEVRELVLFSVHNLISDPPFSRSDLISCRNLLIYLGQHLQLKLMPLFHYALRPSGFLMLGPSENIASHSELFRTLDAKFRIAQRKGTAVDSPAISSLPVETAETNPVGIPRSPAYAVQNQGGLMQVMQRIVLDEFAPKSVIVEEDGKILCASADMHKYLTIGAGNFQNNVIKMARDGLRVGLRATLQEARAKRRRTVHDDLSVRIDGKLQRVMLTVQPMPRVGEDAELFMIVFHDCGLPLAKDEIGGEACGAGFAKNSGVANQGAEAIIAHLERELESKREDLEKSIQDYQTTNEELKASNEELLSLNEEMQSANEELETSKEEIQAGILALSKAHSDLENLFQSTNIATIFLDANEHLIRFTPAACEIYNLIATDVGRPLADITHSAIEMPPIPTIATLSSVENFLEQEVHSRSGRWFLRRTLPYYHAGRAEGVILTFFDITERKRAVIRLATVHEVTRILAGDPAINDIFSQVLQTICTTLNAAYGAIWIVNHEDDKLTCTGTYFDRNRHLLSQFAEQSQQLELECGFGLPGRVWQSRETHWIESLAADGNFLRKRLAAEAGLTSGVALPIDIGSKVYGVIEFFTVARLDRDPPLQDMLKSLGNEIGQFIVRKRLDEDLRDEEARKSEILKAALDAIITMDRQGRIVDFNPAAERIFGFTQEEMKGQSLSETIIPPEYREAHVAGFSRYLKTGTAKVLGRRLELTALRKDGTIFPVELAISASTARNGEPFFTAHMRDITEHKQFVHSIIDRDNRITALLNSTAEGIYGIDLNGLCTFANASAAKILGYASPDDFVGKHMHELVHHTCANGEPYPVENCKIYNAFRLGESVHVNDEVYWRADGTSFDVEYWSYPQIQDGKVIGCVVSFLDITERRASETERTNRETQLQLALTAGKLGAFQWDIATNGIEWSEQVYYIFGSTREQFNGKLDGFFKLLYPDDLEHVRQTIEAELASDSDRHELEFRAVRVSDRQVIWVHSIGKIERDEQGKALRMAGLVSDITERKQLLSELSDREAHLRRVIDNTLGFIGVLDTQGVLREVNQNALIAGGLSRSDVVGKPFSECYWWSHDEQAVQNLKAAIATALTGVAVRYDVVVRMAGDTRMAIDFMLAPVKDSEGNVMHLIPSGIDISERKAAEMEVQQRVNQLNLALASGRMALWEWDIETDHVTLSPQLYKSFGCAVDTFDPTKAGFLKIVHEDDRQKLELMIQSLFNSNCETHEVEFRVIRGDNGEILWNHSRGTVRRDADGNPTSILSVSVDVTERKQRELTLAFLAELQSRLTGFSTAESIIAEASQKVAEYLKLSHCMMVRMDNDATQATVEFDYCTDGSDSLLGVYDMAAFANEDERRQLSAGLPMVVNDTAAPTRSAIFIKNYTLLKIGAILNAPSSRDQNLRFMLSATTRNAHVWREDEVQLLRELANILRLKLDRAHAESALRESEAKFRDLADNISQFAWMTDANGSIFWYNQRWFDYTGSTLEEMQDWGWKSVQHPDHLERVVRHWLTCLESGTVWEDTFPLRSKDGEYRWFLSRAQPIRDEAGNIVRWFGTNTDITEAKQGEEALRASQEQLRLGVDVAQFALAQVDYEQDCVHLTGQAAKLYGLGNEETVVSRKQIHALFHPDDQRKIMDGITQCLDPSGDGELAIAHRVILPDGQIRWLDVRARVSFDRSVHPSRPLTGILAVQDITDKMHWELALAESKERLSMAMESARMGTFEWEPDSDRATWDEQHLALTGLTKENMNGSDFYKLIHPEDAVANQSSIVGLIKGEKDYEVEFRINRPDGKVRWLAGRGKIVRDVGDRPLKFIGLNWDITDAKEQEQRIRESEERLRSAAQAAGFGTVYVDLLTNSATFSDELRKIIGLSGDEQDQIPTQEMPDWIYANDRRAFSAFVQELANLQEGKSSSIDLRIVRPSSEVIWVRLLAKPIFSGVAPLRRPTQVIGTVLDITKQREFERSLDEARALAEAANESKSAFLANMSHEIRTPMTAILGYTDLVADRVQDVDAAAYLQTIRRNGYFLLDIINDILDLSKIEAGMLDFTCERFMPNHLVEDVRSIMEVRAIENNLTLHVEYVGLIPTEIESDAKRLKQILINLVGNAIKFTKKGGVKVVVSYCDQTLTFDIIDTGIGMNRRQLGRLFQPFSQGDQTVNREFGGTGLGLAISQRLAAMLGGNIVVKSEKDKGSTFTVTIATGNISDVHFMKPLLAIQPKVDPPQPVTSELDCRILVVDDRRDIRHLSRRILTGVGARVTEAEDGQVAIRTVLQSIAEGSTFDLILLDMQMPRLDGYETAKRLRSLGFLGPIIALTADAMQGDMSRCIASGCNDYLSKPIDKSDMLKLVSDYVCGSPQNAKNKKLES